MVTAGHSYSALDDGPDLPTKREISHIVEVCIHRIGKNPMRPIKSVIGSSFRLLLRQQLL